MSHARVRLDTIYKLKGIGPFHIVEEIFGEESRQ